MAGQGDGYPVPEPDILTGRVATKVQLYGRIELALGEIAACIALVLLLGGLFLLTAFLGSDGLGLVIRMLLIGGIGALGRTAIFDRPGGMKYGDWLVMWWRFRQRKAQGKLDYRRQSIRPARLVPIAREWQAPLIASNPPLMPDHPIVEPGQEASVQ